MYEENQVKNKERKKVENRQIDKNYNKIFLFLFKKKVDKNKIQSESKKEKKNERKRNRQKEVMMVTN